MFMNFLSPGHRQFHVTFSSLIIIVTTCQCQALQCIQLAVFLIKPCVRITVRFGLVLHSYAGLISPSPLLAVRPSRSKGFIILLHVQVRMKGVVLSRPRTHYRTLLLVASSFINLRCPYLYFNLEKNQNIK